MVPCWLYSYYANLNIPRERRNPAGYYQLCHSNSSTTLPPRLSWTNFYFCISPVIWLKKIVGPCGKLCHPTDFSVRWAERLEYEKTKQSEKCLLHTITIMPIKFLLNHTLEVFYCLRPHPCCSLEPLLWGLPTMDKEELKRRDIYFCHQQTQENILHTEKRVRIPWTQGIKADFNRKLKLHPK